MAASYEEYLARAGAGGGGGGEWGGMDARAYRAYMEECAQYMRQCGWDGSARQARLPARLPDCARALHAGRQRVGLQLGRAARERSGAGRRPG